MKWILNVNFAKIAGMVNILTSCQSEIESEEKKYTPNQKKEELTQYHFREEEMAARADPEFIVIIGVISPAIK